MRASEDLRIAAVNGIQRLVGDSETNMLLKESTTTPGTSRNREKLGSMRCAIENKSGELGRGERLQELFEEEISDRGDVVAHVGSSCQGESPPFQKLSKVLHLFDRYGGLHQLEHDLNTKGDHVRVQRVALEESLLLLLLLNIF
jgi:hypothetical protein